MLQAQTPVIRIQDATLFIPGDRRRRPVLDNISLELLPGRHTAVCGSNGAGKSTLLRLMHGELPLQGGTIAWRQGDAMDYSRITGQEITGLVSPHIQTHCQIYSQGLTGREFLAQAAPENGEDMADLVQRLGAETILTRPMARLSQGQLRLLLLMREILRRPPVLLLDEWAEGLDQGKRRLLLELLAELASRLTMVFTSHREKDLPDFIRERLYLEHGSFVARPERSCARERPREAPPVASSAARTIFELSHVCVYRERQLILKDISWRARLGEHWRITGANGAGKSTLLRLLAGEEFAAAGGQFRHFSPRLGRDVITLVERKCSAPLVSDLGQALYGYPVSALELVLSGLDMAEGIHREYGPQEVRQARAMLDRFLPDIEADRCIRQLSSGQLRRLFLARALMGRPDVLLLDEPCTGLDVRAREEYASLVRLLTSEDAPQPLQLVLVAHDDGDFSGIPFRVAHMDSGRLTVI